MRAAVQVLRFAKRPVCGARLVGRSSGGGQAHSAGDGSATFLRHALLLSRRDRIAHLHILSSSMIFSRASFALVSGLVASGAYFAYRGGAGTSGTTALSKGDIIITTGVPTFLSNPQTQTRSFPTSSLSYAHLDSPPRDFVETPTTSAEAAAQATRKALVVDAGQLWTSTIVGDGPLAKSTDDNGRKVLEMMTPEQATQRIRRNQQSFHVRRGQGVVRYDVVQLASNDPIEDDHAEKIIPHDFATPAVVDDSSAAKSDWMFWGVFDGHSGWTTSATLREQLIPYVSRELNTTYQNASKDGKSPWPTAPAIDAAIKRGFVALDTTIVHDSVAQVLKSSTNKAQAASLLAPALSGSCALLSFYDSATKTLRVACTGDSRAVLGRRSTTNATKWTAHALSLDQTGGTESEAARLRLEHPGEPDVVRNGRILGGLEPSRAFGDASYKWSREVQAKIKNGYFGRTSSPLIRTPPYVTAEPIVTTTQIQPDKGDFVVMATDGLWEMLTNDEVVGLVGQWLEKNPHPAGAVSQQTPKAHADGWLQSWFSGGGGKSANQLPVQPAAPAGAAAGGKTNGQRAPIRQEQWGLSSSASQSGRFVVEDDNAAAHLVRNALGGRDRDMVCALLTLPSPYSRRYRDDLTVEVIFFGDGSATHDGDDGIAVNEAATASLAGELKAKL